MELKPVIIIAIAVVCSIFVVAPAFAYNHNIPVEPSIEVDILKQENNDDTITWQLTVDGTGFEKSTNIRIWLQKINPLDNPTYVVLTDATIDADGKFSVQRNQNGLLESGDYVIRIKGALKEHNFPMYLEFEKFPEDFFNLKPIPYTIKNGEHLDLTGKITHMTNLKTISASLFFDGDDLGAIEGAVLEDGTFRFLDNWNEIGGIFGTFPFKYPVPQAGETIDLFLEYSYIQRLYQNAIIVGKDTAPSSEKSEPEHKEQEKLDEIEKITNENDHSPDQREWITSGPFHIDRSEYAIGEKIFLSVSGLDIREKGEIVIMRPSSPTQYSEYLTIPFDGAQKSTSNHYIEPQISADRGIYSIDDLIGEWTVVFRETNYQNLKFEITEKIIPGTNTEPVLKERVIASFVDKSKDPQSYIDRYNSEPSYKKWFHDNYPEYDSIQQAVGLELTAKIPEWIKNVFLWYGQDQISENELLDAIKYLIDEGILVVN